MKKEPKIDLSLSKLERRLVAYNGVFFKALSRLDSQLQAVVDHLKDVDGRLVIVERDLSEALHRMDAGVQG